MISALAQVDWSDVYNSVDASEAYWLFTDKLANIYNDCVYDFWPHLLNEIQISHVAMWYYHSCHNNKIVPII